MTEEKGTGLKKETAAALSYVLGPITGVAMLLLEKDEYVRFHSMQSIVFGISVIALQWVLGITIILAVLIPLLSLLAFVFWLILIYKALNGEKYEMPIVGSFVKRLLK